MRIDIGNFYITDYCKDNILHSDFRGDGYSYPLLKNLSEYIVGNMKDVKEIRGNISIYNIKSIKTAEKVGYLNNGRKDKDYDYRYSKKSK